MVKSQPRFYKMNFAFNFDFKVGSFKSAESIDTATNLFFWGFHEYLMSHQVAGFDSSRSNNVMFVVVGKN